MLGPATRRLVAVTALLSVSSAFAQSPAWPDSLIEGYAPPSEVAELHAIAAAVSAARIEADIRTLAGFGTRHTLSDTVSQTRGIGAARRWIRAEFERISTSCGGCLEVVEQRSVVSGERRIPDSTVVVNVLAIQRGSKLHKTRNSPATGFIGASPLIRNGPILCSSRTPVKAKK